MGRRFLGGKLKSKSTCFSNTFKNDDYQRKYKNCHIAKAASRCA